MNVMKQYRVAGFVACLSAINISGCSSMMAHTGASQGYYPGARASAEVLTDNQSSWIIKPLAAIDLPFSTIMDTLLLPWDYYRITDTDSPRERVRRSEQANHTNESLAQTAPMEINRSQQ